jgi:ribosomal protein S18 acetylase RimI-like enzyme
VVFSFVSETIVMNIDEYRIATAKDVPELVDLINNAYRPKGAEAGWTHESELIEGERINPQQLAELLEREGSTVLLGLSKAEIVACVNVNEEAGASYIAMLTVRPSYQNYGLGKEMLQLAEEYAENQYESLVFNLFVISERKELFDFYLRRGYEPTEVTSDYPANAGVGNPKISGLKLVLLTKTLA